MQDIRKQPMPGYGIVVIDVAKDYADDNMGVGAQEGTLVKLRQEDKDKVIKGASPLKYGDLLGKRIYWKAYAEADGRFPDDTLGDVIFLDLDKVLGYEQEQA